mgnify:CR=1 FL=1|jgi:hypothetical protein
MMHDVGAETSRAGRLYHESDFSAKDVLAKYRVLGRHSCRACDACSEREKARVLSHRRIAKVRRLLEPAGSQRRSRTGFGLATGYDTGIANWILATACGIPRCLGEEIETG